MEYTNEKEFDSTLQQISDLYEEGKSSCTQAQYPINDQDRTHCIDTAYHSIRQLRDIACHLLKRLHEKNNN